MGFAHQYKGNEFWGQVELTLSFSLLKTGHLLQVADIIDDDIKRFGALSMLDELDLSDKCIECLKRPADYLRKYPNLKKYADRKELPADLNLYPLPTISSQSIVSIGGKASVYLVILFDMPCHPFVEKYIKPRASSKGSKVKLGEFKPSISFLRSLGRYLNAGGVSIPIINPDAYRNMALYVKKYFPNYDDIKVEMIDVCPNEGQIYLILNDQNKKMSMKDERKCATAL